MNVKIPEFDVLVALHQHDPEAFEDFRRHLLREAVNSAPIIHRSSLEGLLSRIEAARNNAGNPVSAAMVAFRMMGDSLHQLGNSWEQALHAVAGLHATLLIERVRH